jgi:TRAP-type mannitol/chloroaromatic compound transport system permease small subunit
LLAMLKAISSAIDGLNRSLALTLCWLVMALVVMEIAVVILRYVFGLSFLPLNDLVQYSHAILFMALAGYVLFRDAHVRIDIFYGKLSARMTALVNLAGVTLLLWPSMIYLAVSAWPYVSNSWRIGEGAATPSGLQGIFFLKSFLLVFPALLILQGLSLAIKSFGELLSQPSSGATSES